MNKIREGVLADGGTNLTKSRPRPSLKGLFDRGAQGVPFASGGVREMLQKVEHPTFEPINRGYNSVFRPNRLSLGLVVPLETYASGPVPTMARHIERVQLAEELGFSAVWLRDVPFNVPAFGDAGQVFDPFFYLGLLAGQTGHKIGYNPGQI